MKVSRGDVVLLDFPFSDATGSKVRPAVVVQNNAHTRRMTSTIVVLITKTIRRARPRANPIPDPRRFTGGKSDGIAFRLGRYMHQLIHGA